jgi:hypothetical protein
MMYLTNDEGRRRSKQSYLDLVQLKPMTLWLPLTWLFQISAVVHLAAAARACLRHAIGQSEAEPNGGDGVNGCLPRGVSVILAAAAPAAAHSIAVVTRADWTRSTVAGATSGSCLDRQWALLKVWAGHRV